MENTMIEIGNRIKLRRKDLKLTQTDIHKCCGIASGALSQIENGTRVPSVLAFYKLAITLKCSMEYLITGESTNSKISNFQTEAEELLHNFTQLPPDDQEDLLVLAKLKADRVRAQIQKGGHYENRHD